MEKKLTFGSVCDGIGCGHLAFDREGCDCLWSAEIEPFPCAVLKERFPTVRNVGNMMKVRGKLKEAFIKAPDVFIGGTPCQAFSIAGKREGLTDARGNLSLEFCRIADGIDAVRHSTGKDGCVVLWENVVGVLSDKGNAFGCFLGMLAGEDEAIEVEKWPRAGVVCGTRRRVAWCVLDSQYFGVAQRRRRVFVVAVPNQLIERLGERADPAEILSIGKSKKRDTPSRGGSREGVAGIAGEGSTWSGLRKDTYGQKEIDRAGSLLSDLRSAVGSPAFEEWIRGIGETFLQQKILFGSMQREESVAEDTESNNSGLGEMCREKDNAKISMQYLWKIAEIGNPPPGSESFEQRAVELAEVMQELSLQTAPYSVFLLCLRSSGEGSQSLYETLAVMEKSYQARMGHTLHGINQGSHWDGSEVHPTINQSAKGSGGIGASNQEIFSQRGGGLVGVRMVAFGEYAQDETASTMKQRDYKDATDLAIYENHANDSRVTGPLDVSPMLSARMGTGGGNVPLVGPGAIAINTKQQSQNIGDDVANTIGANDYKEPQAVLHTSTVRRLLPQECEKLQGLPPGWTLIPWKNKPAADCPDGPRYKGLGNGQTVQVMQWLAMRIRNALTGDTL